MARTPKPLTVIGAGNAAQQLGWRAPRPRHAALFSARGGLHSEVPLAIDRFLAETRRVAKRKTPAPPAIRNPALTSVAGEIH